MDIDAQTIWMIVALLVLTLLMTGPGMWSEKWGWKALDRLLRRKNQSK